MCAVNIQCPLIGLHRRHRIAGAFIGLAGRLENSGYIGMGFAQAFYLEDCELGEHIGRVEIVTGRNMGFGQFMTAGLRASPHRPVLHLSPHYQAIPLPFPADR